MKDSQFLKTSISFLIFVLFTTILSAQSEPQLISDFNPGANDGFNKFEYKGAFLGDNLYVMQGDNGETGLELVNVTLQNVTLIKDINPGADGSNPQYFIEQDSKAYFSAADPENGGAIWQTDGTENETFMVFDPSSSSSVSLKPKHLIKSESGKIYFTYEDLLFYFDPSDGSSKELASGVRFTYHFNNNSPNFCTYKDVVAYIIEGNNDEAELYAATDPPTLLGTYPGIGSFTDLYGISEVDNGILFHMEDSFDEALNGSYLFDESSNEITKYQINPGSMQSPHRVAPFGKKQLLLYPGEATFVVDGNESNNNKILNTSWGGYAGQEYPYIHVDDHLFFAGEDVSFGGQQILVYEISKDLITADFETEQGEISNMIDNTNAMVPAVVFYDGVVNSTISYQYEVFYPTSNDFYVSNAFEGIFSTEIKVLGVLGGGALFSGKLDDNIGYELYGQVISHSVDTENLTEGILTNDLLILNEIGAKFEFEKEESLIFEVYDISGRLHSSTKGFTNQLVALEYPFAINIVVAKIAGQAIAKQYVKPN